MTLGHFDCVSVLGNEVSVTCWSLFSLWLPFLPLLWVLFVTCAFLFCFCICSPFLLSLGCFSTVPSLPFHICLEVCSFQWNKHCHLLLRWLWFRLLIVAATLKRRLLSLFFDLYITFVLLFHLRLPSSNFKRNEPKVFCLCAAHHSFVLEESYKGFTVCFQIKQQRCAYRVCMCYNTFSMTYIPVMST